MASEIDAEYASWERTSGGAADSWAAQNRGELAAAMLSATLRFHPFPQRQPPGGKELLLVTTSKVFRKGDLYRGEQWRTDADPGWNGKEYEYALKSLGDVIYWSELPDAVALANAAESRPASGSCLLEDVLRCRYPVCQSITPSGFGWDTPRLNEVIAAHTASLARPVDEGDFYGVEDAIAQALRDCENEDPDTCSLSPKTLRRLRMALTAARGPCPTCDGSGEIIDRNDECTADPCPACVPGAAEKWCASCQLPRRRCVCPPWGSAGNVGVRASDGKTFSPPDADGISRP